MFFLNYNPIITFLFIGLLELTTYGAVYFGLNTYNKNFINIKPTHKKSYVVINLVKSLYLCALTFLFIYYFILNSIFNYNVLFYLGSTYILLDIIALIVVNKMQINTKIHHIIVQILFGICYLYNFDTNNYIVNGIIVYTIFSSVAFMVNGFLGLRIFIKDKWLITYAKISMYIYIFSCMFNWIYQIYILHNLSVSIGLIYFTLLILIINDDITLIKYLYNFNKIE